VIGISKLRGDARRSDIVGVSLVVRNIQVGMQALEETLRQHIAQQASERRATKSIFMRGNTINLDQRESAMHNRGLSRVMTSASLRERSSSSMKNEDSPDLTSSNAPAIRQPPKSQQPEFNKDKL